MSRIFASKKDHKNFQIKTKTCVECQTIFVEYYEHFDPCECGECLEA